MLQSVDWLKKSCVTVVTGDINHILAGVPSGSSAPEVAEVAEVAGQPYALTSEHVTDRLEFEGLAGIVAGCVRSDDLLYLRFDSGTKKNLMLFSTKDPGDRQKCLVTEDMYLEAT